MVYSIGGLNRPILDSGTPAEAAGWGEMLYGNPHAERSPLRVCFLCSALRAVTGMCGVPKRKLHSPLSTLQGDKPASHAS